MAIPPQAIQAALAILPSLLGGKKEKRPLPNLPPYTPPAPMTLPGAEVPNVPQPGFTPPAPVPPAPDITGAFQGKAAGKKPIAAAVNAAAKPPGLFEQFKGALPKVATAIGGQVQQAQQDRRERLRAMMRSGAIGQYTPPEGGGFQMQPVRFTGLFGG